MGNIKIIPKERIELIKLHKIEPCRTTADRIKTILLLDDQTIRNYEKKYLECGFDGLILDGYKGGISKLRNCQEIT